MSTARRALAVVAVVMALGLVFTATRGLPPPAPNPPGTFSFAALGDAPYYDWEELKFTLVTRALDADDFSFVVHVGDSFWRPCSDEHYQSTRDTFNALRHPIIYTPGDNEWTDCWEPGSGGFAPLERLARLRQIFFADPAQSLGARRLALESQASRPPFAEFVENARWTHAGLVFATVHIVGTGNGTEPFPGRTATDDEAAQRRTDAAAAWTRETFAAADAANAPAVVLAFHATAHLEAPATDGYRRRFEPFLTAVEEEAERFGRPVLLVHGDGHVYTVDSPMVRQTTGQRLAHVTRLQVPGSPRVGWVRIVVTPGAAAPFAFDPHVVPSWKYW